MKEQWATACQEASRPMGRVDRIAIAILAAGAVLAALGWIVFDGTRAL
jgi:hypothetical protein